MLKVLSNILCDLDPKVKVIGQKADICNGVPSTSALVLNLVSYLSVQQSNIHPLGAEDDEMHCCPLPSYLGNCASDHLQHLGGGIIWAVEQNSMKYFNSCILSDQDSSFGNLQDV